MRSRERSLDLALRIVNARTPALCAQELGRGVGPATSSVSQRVGRPSSFLALEILARARLRRRRD